MVNVLEIIVTLIFLLFAGWLIYQKIKLALSKKEALSTPTTVIPATPTPPTPSGGWKSWFVPAIAVLTILIIVGALFYTGIIPIPAVVTDTAKGLVIQMKSSPAKEEINVGCSAQYINDAGNPEFKILFDEMGISGYAPCSPLMNGQEFTFRVVKGKTTFFGNDKSTSEVDSKGVPDNRIERKLIGGENSPIGALMFTVQGQTPWIELSKVQYFKVTATDLEVYDIKGGNLTRKFPITLPPSTGGGMGSYITLRVNALCEQKNKKDNSQICTAAYEVRQEYFKK